MRVIQRRRDPNRQSHVSIVVAVGPDVLIEPGDVVMLEGLGACFVLSVGEAEGDATVFEPGERAIALEVETLALGNLAPDLP